jgi:hypothetical protein
VHQFGFSPEVWRDWTCAISAPLRDGRGAVFGAQLLGLISVLGENRPYVSAPLSVIAGKKRLGCCFAPLGEFP